MFRIANFKKILLSLILLGISSVMLCLAWWFIRIMPVSVDQYHLRGKFGPVVAWPLIPLQVITLPDGRLMSYGSDAKGRQSGLEIYDVWDPAKGVGPDSHLTLPNTTGADLFCSGQVLLPGRQSVLMVGGDLTINGKRNFASAKVNYFQYAANTIKPAEREMASPRWYPTVATLSNGDILVLGGRLDSTHFAPMPEVYKLGQGWSTLPGAASDEAFGSLNWDYPRAWQTSRGDVFVISIRGDLFSLDTEGKGQVRKLDARIDSGHDYLPSLMYAPGKILSMRMYGSTYNIDINNQTPEITALPWFGIARYNASATVMADGEVFLNGGGLRHDGIRHHLLANRLAKIWDPISRQLKDAAVSQKNRLYHSTALLLPDATVFTGGGGAGHFAAENNLDAEIYYPPYLFEKNDSGRLASRPVIKSAPQFIEWGKEFKVESESSVGRFTLIKLGSATHAQVFDQRFIELSFSKFGPNQYKVASPSGRNIAPPGYYFLFAFDKDGVPSVAKIVKLEVVPA